jgi:hypothetical protein
MLDKDVESIPCGCGGTWSILRIEGIESDRTFYFECSKCSRNGSINEKGIPKQIAHVWRLIVG